MAAHQKRALVTGGAGLIGSHIADLLIREGWRVRILDNLEPNTHKLGRPSWINPAAEFVQGNVQDYSTMVQCFQSMTAHPVTPLVRVPWNEPGIIGKALDGGAWGII